MIRRFAAALLAVLLLLTAAAPAETAETEIPTSAPEPTPKPADGYVLVQSATQVGWVPLPSEGELSLPLKQILPDGKEAVNTIHLTPNGVWMEDSTCEGHDCVKQGEVTLENKDDRILGNMIICLPNQVTLSLYTPEEVLALMTGN